MIVTLGEQGAPLEYRADVCVVGAGPAGIVLALELERQGCRVLLLESGPETSASPDSGVPEAVIVDPAKHAEMKIAVQRQLGGTSGIWGGRCVPMDPIDFEVRDYVPDSGWPIAYDDVAAHLPAACSYSMCGEATFTVSNGVSLVPGFQDGDVLATSIERWSLPTNFGREYRRVLAASGRITVVLCGTCIAIDLDESGREVTSIRFVGPAGETGTVKARHFVLACGGLETTRLLLNSDSRHPHGLGNHGGKLGQFYMGHVSGKIARVTFATRSADTLYGFERDREGVYLRRRFTIADAVQRRERIMNCALWLDNPHVSDPAHGSAILSLAYLALSLPHLGPRLAPEAIRRAIVGSASHQVVSHVGNVLRGLPRALAFAVGFVARRYFGRRRLPGFFVWSPSNTYAIHYHSEHAPERSSRVWLDRERDRFGLRKLVIDLRFGEQDARTVVRTHELLARQLAVQGLGRLHFDSDDLENEVLRQASDGFHQAGTTRMSESPMDGVVDPDCRVHGTQNLYVASSSVFPTSGQANSTLTLLALSVRLANHLSVVSE